MMIVAGDYSLTIFEGTEQEMLPQLLFPHPEYNTTTTNNDIMLIKVQTSGLFFECLAPSVTVGRFSLIKLFTISPAEGPGPSEQLRLHRSAAPAGCLHRRGQIVSRVRVGIHQRQWRPDPLHPAHCHAAHRLHRTVQQQWVFWRQHHRKHAVCWFQWWRKGRLSGKKEGLVSPRVWRGHHMEIAVY